MFSGTFSLRPPSLTHDPVYSCPRFQTSLRSFPGTRFVASTGDLRLFPLLYQTGLFGGLP